MSVSKNFKKYGYAFKQIKRQEQIAIYSQSLNNELVAFEVVKLRFKPNRFKDNEVLEMYPSSSEFGNFGWSFLKLNTAMKKYEDMIKN